MNGDNAIKEERRPPIPDAIKRSVRQRCAFGCVICGLPLYEYHHMIPYAKCNKHEEHNITLLCDKHHNEITRGLLTEEDVTSADSDPYNNKKGVSSPYALHLSGIDFVVEIGSNKLSGGCKDKNGNKGFIPISVDDIDLLWLTIDKNQNVFFNMRFFDECNLVILQVVDNELIYKTDTWDITFVGTSLTIRQESRKIYLEIEFCPPDRIKIIRGRFLCNGVEIIIKKTQVLIAGSMSSLHNCTLIGGLIGIQVGRNDRGYSSVISNQNISRYNVDRKEQK